MCVLLPFCFSWWSFFVLPPPHKTVGDWLVYLLFFPSSLFYFLLHGVPLLSLACGSSCLFFLSFLPSIFGCRGQEVEMGRGTRERDSYAISPPFWLFVCALFAVENGPGRIFSKSLKLPPSSRRRCCLRAATVGTLIILWVERGSGDEPNTRRTNEVEGTYISVNDLLRFRLSVTKGKSPFGVRPYPLRRPRVVEFYKSRSKRRRDGKKKNRIRGGGCIGKRMLLLLLLFLQNGRGRTGCLLPCEWDRRASQRRQSCCVAAQSIRQIGCDIESAQGLCQENG